MKIPVKMFFQNNDEVSDLTAGVNLLLTLILKFRCFICFCLGLKIIVVLLVLRMILFAQSHQQIKARSSFTCLLIF